ncbi:MAG: hypothetical protein GX267_19005 [Fibrobacter sp.]|jgi:hypothetical protein|nr:hypothetical protein [Fibrobacter sp.]
MRKAICLILTIFIGLVLNNGCDKTNPLKEIDYDHSIYEVIKHAAIHMQDHSGYAVRAAAYMPGAHLEKDSIKHRRIDIYLPVEETAFGGYIHFGPELIGDMIVCINVETPLFITNCDSLGNEKALKIERTFSSNEIADSANTSLVKTAILFEAQPGANILKIGPVSQSLISLIIEEATHEHND